MVRTRPPLPRASSTRSRKSHAQNPSAMPARVGTERVRARAGPGSDSDSLNSDSCRRCHLLSGRGEDTRAHACQFQRRNGARGTRKASERGARGDGFPVPQKTPEFGNRGNRPLAAHSCLRSGGVHSATPAAQWWGRVILIAAVRRACIASQASARWTLGPP